MDEGNDVVFACIVRRNTTQRRLAEKLFQARFASSAIVRC